MPTENERKWIMPERAPADLPEAMQMIEIRQAYLTRPQLEVEVRVRERWYGNQGTTLHTLSMKSNGSAESRMEISKEITSEEFEEVWGRCQSRQLEKTRWKYLMGPLEGQPDVTLEIDVFDHFDLQIGEIEFDSLNQLTEYEPPSWFGEEVTGKEGYRNAAIAIHTSPHKFTP